MMLFIVNGLDNEEDKEFIKNLYNKYMPWLRCRAHNFVEDMNVYEDLAQDCMVNMIKYIDTVKSLPESKQRAYMKVAVDNISKNYLKRSSRTVTMNNFNSSDLDFIADDYNLEDEIDMKFDYETIRTAFDTLKDRDKYIIGMKYDLKLNDGQIADVLQIDKNSVRMTVGRSVRKLKKAIIKSEGK